MPSNRIFMSSTVSIATPALPTSPTTRGMIAVIAAVRGEIERDREAFLPGGEIAAIEGVRVLGRGEAGILADRPGAAGIHRRAHAAREGGEAGKAGVDRGGILGRVERFDRDALGRLPGEIAALHLLRGQARPNRRGWAWSFPLPLGEREGGPQGRKGEGTRGTAGTLHRTEPHPPKPLAWAPPSPRRGEGARRLNAHRASPSIRSARRPCPWGERR